jgi:TolA-binding protein
MFATFAVLFCVLFQQPNQAPATAPADEAFAVPEASREARDTLIAEARQRMRQDRDRYTPEQLKEAEDLYQVANKDWRSDSARAALRVMIEKYPDVNRTGCAVLYLGQMSRGDEAEQHFRDAIEKYGDCRYGNGVQVGALARLYLAGKCLRERRIDEAETLLAEIENDFPGAIDHRGRLLSGHAMAMRKQINQLAPPATRPGN